ncbi:conserved Plasmodium protein, unknown function [Plasmodium vinckei brucechwatti]|uniref:Uncharacterized protein n=1 Tax=Plasmodium vinckei brucechwatti TaxID=119398 RepID=A0A6V7SWA1_PLAVN|nr:conserved Plasmodium protein, unknown function [Plasmodium vinckei brucechwatti]
MKVWLSPIGQFPSIIPLPPARKLTTCFFATVSLYKPSKFKDIKKKLYLRKRLFKMFYKTKDLSDPLSKRDKSISVNLNGEEKEELFLNRIIKYPTNKTRIYKNNKYNISKEAYEDKLSIEKIIFKSSTLGYIELQYILTTFINYEKNELSNEDIIILNNFLNLSEKEILDYLCANELMPDCYKDAKIIRKLLMFINSNHPSLS